MKTFFAFLLLSTSFMIDIDKTAAINRLKQNAEIAFKNGYFLVASKKYDSLIKHFEVKEPQILLNLAHCYYQLKDSVQSRRYYRYITDSVPDKNMRSIAYQQLGNIEAQTRSIPTYQKAVNYFKNALKVQPENKEARHNYEVARKILNELQQQKQNQQNQNQDQKQDKKDQNQKDEQQKTEEQKQKDKKDQQQKGEQQKKEGEQQEKDKKEQNQKGDKNKKDKKDDKDGKSQEEKEADSKDAEKKDKEGDMKNAKATDEKGKGEEKEIEANELRSQRLKNMNLTPESAQMILDAMKNSETQYLQQNRRKQKRVVKPNTKDW